MKQFLILHIPAYLLRNFFLYLFFRVSLVLQISMSFISFFALFASLLAMLCCFHLTSFSKLLLRSCLVTFSLRMYFKPGGILFFDHLHINLISDSASSSSNLSISLVINLVFVCCFRNPIFDHILLINFFNSVIQPLGFPPQTDIQYVK